MKKKSGVRLILFPAIIFALFIGSFTDFNTNKESINDLETSSSTSSGKAISVTPYYSYDIDLMNPTYYQANVETGSYQAGYSYTDPTDSSTFNKNNRLIPTYTQYQIEGYMNGNWWNYGSSTSGNIRNTWIDDTNGISTNGIGDYNHVSQTYKVNYYKTAIGQPLKLDSRRVLAPPTVSWTRTSACWWVGGTSPGDSRIAYILLGTAPTASYYNNPWYEYTAPGGSLYTKAMLVSPSVPASGYPGLAMNKMSDQAGGSFQEALERSTNELIDENDVEWIPYCADKTATVSDYFNQPATSDIDYLNFQDWSSSGIKDGSNSLYYLGKDDASMYDSSNVSSKMFYTYHCTGTNNDFWDDVGVETKYFVMKFNMAKNFDLNQEMDIPISVPAGYSFQSAMLETNNLWLPNGVKLQVENAAGTSWVDQSILEYYQGNYNINVLSSIKAGNTIKIRIFGSQYASVTDASLIEGSSDNRWWFPAQSVYCDNMKMHVVLKKTATPSMQLISSPVDNGNSRTWNALDISLDKFGIMGGSVSNIKLQKIIMDFNYIKSSTTAMALSPNNITQSTYSFTSFLGPNTISAGNYDYASGIFTLWIDPGYSGAGNPAALKVWFDNFMIGSGSVTCTFSFNKLDQGGSTGTNAFVSVLANYNLKKGTKGSTNHQLWSCSKFIPQEELVIQASLSSLWALGYSYTTDFQLAFKLNAGAWETIITSGGTQNAVIESNVLFIYYTIPPTTIGPISLTLRARLLDDSSSIIYESYYYSSNFFEVKTFNPTLNNIDPFNSSHVQWSFSVDSAASATRDIFASSLSTSHISGHVQEATGSFLGDTDRDDDFEMYGNGEDLTNKPGWSPISGKTHPTVIIDGSNKIAHFTTISCGANWVLPNQGDISASGWNMISFSIMISSTTSTTFEIQLLTSTGAVDSILKFDSGNLKITDGGIGTLTTLQTYSANTWYGIQYYFKTTANLYYAAIVGGSTYDKGGSGYAGCTANSPTSLSLQGNIPTSQQVNFDTLDCGWTYFHFNKMSVNQNILVNPYQPNSVSWWKFMLLDLEVHSSNFASMILTMSIVPTINTGLFVYKRTYPTQNLNVGTTTIQLNITIGDPSSILPGTVPLRAASYMFKLDIELDGKSKLVYSVDSSSDYKFSNSLILTGLPQNYNEVNLPYKNPGGSGDYVNLHVEYFKLFKATDITTLITIYLPNTATLYGGGLTCTSNDGRYTARTYGIKVGMAGVYPSMSPGVISTTAATDGSNYKINIYKRLTSNIYVTDADGDLQDANVKYKITRGVTEIRAWTAMTVNGSGIYSFTITNLVSAGLVENAVPYVILFNATDYYKHSATATQTVRVYSDVPVIQDARIYDKNDYYYYDPLIPGWVPSYPSFIRYNYPGVKVIVSDPDTDIPSNGATYTFNATGWSSSRYTLNVGTPTSGIYTMLNYSSVDLTGVPEAKAGSVFIDVRIRDNQGHEVHATLGFTLNIWSPTLASKFPESPSNTFTHYQLVTVRFEMQDLDRDLGSSAIFNVTGVGIANAVANFTVSGSNLTWNPSISRYVATYTYNCSSWGDGTYKAYIIITDALSHKLTAFTDINIVSYSPSSLTIIQPEASSTHNIVDAIYVQALAIDFDLDINASYFQIYNATGPKQYNSTWIQMTFGSLSGNTHLYFKSYSGIPSNLQSGTYTIQVKFTDKLKHKVSSSTVDFQFIAFAPMITAVDPLQDDIFRPKISSENSFYVFAEVTDPDDDIDKVKYRVYNYTGSAWLNSKTSMTEGYTTDQFESASPFSISSCTVNQTMHVYIYANDTGSRETVLIVVIYIRVYFPKISSVTPDWISNNNLYSYWTSDTIIVQATVTDTDLDITDVKVKFKLDGDTYETAYTTMTKNPITDQWSCMFNPTPATLMYVNKVYYKVIINATDSLKHSTLTSSQNYYFFMKDKLPLIYSNLISPAEASTKYYNDAFTITVPVTTNSTLKHLTYTFLDKNNISLTLTNTFPTYKVYSINYKPTINVSTSLYSMTFRARDSYNLESTLTINIYIESHEPQIASITPVEGTIFNYKDIQRFSVIVLDPDADSLPVIMEVRDPVLSLVINNTMTFTGGSWIYDYNFENHVKNSSLEIIFHAYDAFPHHEQHKKGYKVEVFSPTMRIEQPLNATILRVTSLLSLVVNINDADDDVEEVTARLNNDQENTPMVYLTKDLISGKWKGSLSLATTTVGKWKLVVMVIDNLGHSLINNSLTMIIINTAPSIIINSPTGNQKLTANFTVQATITDLDNDLKTAWVELNNINTIMSLIGGKWQALIDIYKYPYNTYDLKVKALDDNGNIATSIVSVRMNPPEIIHVLEEDINYKISNVTAKSYINATILIIHDASLRSMELVVFLPSSWKDVVIDIYNAPYMRRGLQTIKLNLYASNSTHLVFNSYTYFQATDEIILAVKTPEVSYVNQYYEESGGYTYNIYEYTMKTYRFFENVHVVDLSLLLATAGGEWTLQFQIGIYWVAVDSLEYEFQVYGSQYSIKVAFVLPNISVGEEVKFRIIQSLPPAGPPINVQGYIYGGVLCIIPVVIGVLIRTIKKQGTYNLPGFVENKWFEISMYIAAPVIFFLCVFLFA